DYYCQVYDDSDVLF
nr:immunoglobulin light chain junction region [Macaca mulatta]MOW14921.1 immunoglobulin light chain junction region [Macaca mulatta]MOW14927.1 immunoglobulin light chain junction region [Macaca mulatta]MOW14997.1 immunoglobulin light chain junction region [Macaca mulatta]MOW15051.1 immunoglobulin light chain junction region [Macaca mulatta]